MFWFVLVAIGLAIATAMAIFGGLPRATPHVFWPLMVASSAWGLAAIYEVWFESVNDSKVDIRLDYVVILIGLLSTTVVCVTWSVVFLLIDRHRSRKSQPTRR
jgi:hypothetical protein